ncbi:unnamed protein product [marine sediment metagenome]|uniref:Uncharacterized protein n=1 Tax=marine sediment metagenome TaxID=412755 RepID=X1UT38_9ZZZZ
MKLEKSFNEIMNEKLEHLINEERRNVLNRYCRKVDYYCEVGYSREAAQIKAKRYYKFIK